MKNINILIIEDELIIYMHITKVLKNMGLNNIFVAKNSKKAISITKENKIDLILSDIKINGEMDGLDTVKILNSLYKIPTIFISAFNDEETIKKASKLDFYAFLLKPYREDELKMQICLVIQRYNLNSEVNKIINISEYKYNEYKQKIYLNNNEIFLTKKEYLFLSLLINKMNNIILYNIIDEVVWLNENVSDNTRRTFIYRFKAKLDKLDLTVEKNIGIGLFYERRDILAL